MRTNTTSTQGTRNNAIPKALVGEVIPKETTLKKHDRTISMLSSEIKYLQAQRLQTVNEIISDVLTIVKTDKHLSEMAGKAKRRQTALKLYRNGIAAKELTPYSKRALSVAGKLIELDLLDSFKWKLFPLSKLELVLRTNEQFIKRLHKEHKNKDNDDYVSAFITEIKLEAQVSIKTAVKKFDSKKLSTLN